MSVKEYDIAIIGGGVIGLSLARELIARKRRVAVIDAGSIIPPATNAAAGMLAPSFEESVNDPEALYRFSADSLALWPSFAAALEEETGLSIDYRSDGILGVALTGEQAQALEERCAALNARGAAAEMLDGDAVRKMEPALSSSIVAGLYAAKDAQVDPRKLLIALKASVTAGGGDLIRAQVEKASAVGERCLVSLASGGSVAADKLVLASGATGAPLIEDLPPPPLVPVKGEALAVEAPDKALSRVVRGPGAYLCPKAGARFVIGATEYRERRDLDVDDEGVRGLKVNAAAILPATVDFKETERWAGLRPGTPDGAPILGPDARGPARVFLALGHYRNGILLSPQSAAALAASLTGESPLTGLKPFRPERFG